MTGYERCQKCADKGRDTSADNMVIYDDTSGYCFQCHYYKQPIGWQWPKSYKEVDDGKKSCIPGDFTREIPTEAWQWLLQFGLPWSYWQEYCGYSETTGRLVFSVGTPLVFSIGRLVKDSAGNPPWNKGKWYVWGEAHKHAEVIHPAEDQRTTGNIVLVEDIVSAHKVGQVADCVPLFGVNISPAVKWLLMSSVRPVSFWLDKDQEGATARKAVELQSLTGKKVNIIVTDNDPKTYSIDKIKGFIA